VSPDPKKPTLKKPNLSPKILASESGVTTPKAGRGGKRRPKNPGVSQDPMVQGVTLPNQEAPKSGDANGPKEQKSPRLPHRKTHIFDDDTPLPKRRIGGAKPQARQEKTKTEEALTQKRTETKAPLPKRSPSPRTKRPPEQNRTSDRTTPKTASGQAALSGRRAALKQSLAQKANIDLSNVKAEEAFLDRQEPSLFAPSSSGQRQALPSQEKKIEQAKTSKTPSQQILQEKDPKSGYSNFVTITKWALPLVSVCVLALIALWPELYGPDGLRIPELAGVEINPRGSLSMVNPRFEGVDENNRAFTVLSDAANRNAENENLIELDRPKANMKLADGSDIHIESDTGVFEREDQIVDLFGAVHLRHQDGHQFRTDSGRFHMKTKAAMGEAPVEGESPMGKINSIGFALKPGGQQIIFKGPATLILYQETIAGENKTSNAPAKPAAQGSE